MLRLRWVNYITNARCRLKKVSKVLSDSGSDKYYIFLEKLRKSGVTNMYGAAPYLLRNLVF